MLFVTDFDGTLLNDDGFVSPTDIAMLHRLGNLGFVRVIATGRSPFSLAKAIDASFPVDYVIFSTGAGIYNWATKELLYTRHLEGEVLSEVANIFKGEDLTFMVQHEIPENHYFSIHYGANHSEGTNNRLRIYEDYYKPLLFSAFPEKVAQFLAVLPKDDHYFECLKRKFSDVKVIKATSPLNDGYYWMEIFAEDVSKAKAIEWLQNIFQTSTNDVMVVGNDYNDLDMLHAYQNSYVVENSPDEFKVLFTPVASNNNSGFSDACNQFLTQKGIGV